MRTARTTAFVYVHCDVPPSMTLDEYRLARNRARRASRPEAHGERRGVLVPNLRRWIGER